MEIEEIRNNIKNYNVEDLQKEHVLRFGFFPQKYVNLDDEDDLYIEILARALYVDDIPMTVNYIYSVLKEKEEEDDPESMFTIMY